MSRTFVNAFKSNVTLKHFPHEQQLEFKLQGHFEVNLGGNGALYTLDSSTAEIYLVVRAELEGGRAPGLVWALRRRDVYLVVCGN
jgi:hypothetical protein